MATELLSFRLSGTELEWLKSQQESGETLNLTAKRLLLTLMNQTVDTPVDTSVDTPIDTNEIEQKLEKKIDAKFEELYQQFANNLNYILDKRFEEFQQQSTPVDTSVYTTVDTPKDNPKDSLTDMILKNPTSTLIDPSNIHIHTRDQLAAHTVDQLRVYAKNLGISYKYRDNKAKLIDLISARKSTY